MATSYSRYPWLCPDPRFGPNECDPPIEEVCRQAQKILKGMTMHYRNGREAKNGDKIVMLDSNGQVTAFGVLHSAKPGDDYCNGFIAAIQYPNATACMCDCLHSDDVAAILKEKGLDKRPAGK